MSACIVATFAMVKGEIESVVSTYLFTSTSGRWLQCHNPITSLVNTVWESCCNVACLLILYIGSRKITAATNVQQTCPSHICGYMYILAYVHAYVCMQPNWSTRFCNNFISDSLHQPSAHKNLFTHTDTYSHTRSHMHICNKDERQAKEKLMHNAPCRQVLIKYYTFARG